MWIGFFRNYLVEVSSAGGPFKPSFGLSGGERTKATARSFTSVAAATFVQDDNVFVRGHSQVDSGGIP